MDNSYLYGLNFPIGYSERKFINRGKTETEKKENEKSLEQLMFSKSFFYGFLLSQNKVDPTSLKYVQATSKRLECALGKTFKQMNELFTQNKLDFYPNIYFVLTVALTHPSSFISKVAFKEVKNFVKTDKQLECLARYLMFFWSFSKVKKFVLANFYYILNSVHSHNNFLKLFCDSLAG